MFKKFYKSLQLSNFFKLFVLYMLEVISAGVRMTTIDTIGNIPTIQNGNVVNNQPKVNFRASAQADNPVDSFISEQEKAKKKGEKFNSNISNSNIISFVLCRAHKTANYKNYI